MIPKFEPGEARVDKTLVDGNQWVSGSSKTEPLTKPGEKMAAKIGAERLSPKNENVHPTEVQRRTRRTAVSSHAKEQNLDVSEMISVVKENKKSASMSLIQSREQKASAELARDNSISPGRKKLLTNISNDPDQLEKDLKRLGTVTVGKASYQATSFENFTPKEVYDHLSAELLEYIAKKNPNIKIDENQMDEILNSTTQTNLNDLLDRRAEKAPKFPWGGGVSTMETSFKLEGAKTWTGKPETLVVSKSITKSYENADDPSAPKKLLVMDARVKFNLKTNDVEFEYEMSIKEDGMKKAEYREIWDPTKEMQDPATGKWVSR